MALDDDLELPRDLGSYTLLKRLAVGGMAEVYVAKTKGIGGFEKQVAVKVIHPRYSEDEHFVQMLVEEAKISVLLTHVNIAQTFDLGRHGDQYYIVMEFIEGADAYRVMRKCAEQKRAMPIDVATFAVSEICSGLDYAHRKRATDGSPLHIVHRDISPQNVLISFSGEVKLVDFGIAKAASRSEHTEAGVIKGKYYYMSPEQAWGDPMDHRSDIFSTGVVLYELLTGRMLYTDENVVVLLDKVRKADIPRPEKRRPSIPKELSDIIMKALAKSPDDRYQSAQEFGQALQSFLYSASPTFSAARLGELMGQLYPEQAQRHSSTGSLSPPDQDRAPTPMPPKPAAKGVDMSGWGDDEDDATRHDVLPFRRLSAAADDAAKRKPLPDRPEGAPALNPLAPRPVPADLAAMARPTSRPSGRDPLKGTAPIEVPKGPGHSTDRNLAKEGATSTDERRAADDWDDPTRLRGERRPGDDEFEDSTLIDSSGAVKEARALLAQGKVVESGRGRVHVNAPPKSAKPASIPPPPKARAWSQRPPAAAPPSRPLPVSTARTEPVELPADPLAAPMLPQARQGMPAPPMPGVPKARPLPPPVAPTVPLAQPPAPAVPSTALLPSPSAAYPSQAYPTQADDTGRFGGRDPQAGPWPEAPQQPQAPFPSSPFPSGPFSSSPGTSPAAWPSPPMSTDPFAPPPALSTQAQRAQDDLGRPRPFRILVGLLLLVCLAVLSALAVTWLTPDPPAPALAIVTNPPGATVLLDGTALPGTTPLMVNSGLVEGQSYTLGVRLEGYSNWDATILVRPGTTTQEITLVNAAVRLHIDTVPPGASISINGATLGAAPLDAASLFMGQQVVVRATLAGYAPAQTMLVLANSEETVTLTLTATP